MSQEQFTLNWHTYSDHLKDLMQNLMQSNKSSDVTIVCEDKTRYKVHKFVLNACSPVFQSIIDNLPENEGSVVYLRGVFSQEMKSIIQFMYLGQATFYQNRMNEFLNVARSLEIKELSKDIEYENEDISQVQEKTEYVQYDYIKINEDEDNKYIRNVMEKSKYTETKVSSYQNENSQFSCDNCGKKFAYKQSLLRHVQAVHNGVKFQCDLCDASYSQVNNLKNHKKYNHEE